MESIRARFSPNCAPLSKTEAQAVSQTLQSLILEGLKSQDFDRESIDFLITLLSLGRLEFDARLLGGGPWQAVRSCV